MGARPVPSTGERADWPPTILGAMKALTWSASLASINPVWSWLPPSTRSLWIPRSFRRLNASSRKGGPSSGAASRRTTCAPALRRASILRESTLQCASRMTGPSVKLRRSPTPRVFFNKRAPTGTSRRGSKMTRAGVSGTPRVLLVRRGSSASTVRLPTMTASTWPRRRWTLRRDRSPEIHFELPSFAAIFPSSVAAHLSIT